MLKSLGEYLVANGYSSLDYNGKIYATQIGEQMAIIRIYSSSEIGLLDAKRICEEREMIQQTLMQQGVQLFFSFMSLFVIPDGVTEHMRAIEEEIRGLWFVSERQKQVIVYEHQSVQYFGLYEILNEFLGEEPWQLHRAQQRRETLKLVQPVTLGLVVINVLVYLITSSLGDVYSAEDMYRFGAVTATSIMEEHEYWRLFAAMFLHYGISHLANNMVSLLLLGSMLEKQMGHLKYAIMYIGAGLGGGICSAALDYYQYMHLRQGITHTGLSLLQPLTETTIKVSAGASGAIFGITGGLLAMVFLQRVFHRKRTQELPLRNLLWMTAISLFVGFTSTGVDNVAHVGGLVAGFLFTVLLAGKE